MAELPATLANGLFRIGLTVSFGVVATVLIITTIDYAYERHLQTGGEEAHVHYAEAIKRNVPHPSQAQVEREAADELDWEERCEMFDTLHHRVMDLPPSERH
jgi:hypothetical protein